MNFQISHLNLKSFFNKAYFLQERFILDMSRTHTQPFSAKNMYVFTNSKGTSWFMGLKFVFFFLLDHKDIVNISKPY